MPAYGVVKAPVCNVDTDIEARVYLPLDARIAYEMSRETVENMFGGRSGAVRGRVGIQDPHTETCAHGRRQVIARLEASAAPMGER